MESLDVKSKVDELTPWYAGMVVVPKKSGKVHICVDLKHFNESILQEVHSDQWTKEAKIICAK